MKQERSEQEKKGNRWEEGKERWRTLRGEGEACIFIWGIVVSGFFFWFEIHTARTPITAGTHADGGAVIRKPGSAWLEGTPAISIIFMSCFMIVVLNLK